MTVPSGKEWTTALRMMDTAGTWEELRGDLDRLGILGVLDADQRRTLAALWEERGVANLGDHALVQDLTHWASGLGRTDHPLGFKAPRPDTLVAEAARRGWFTKPLPGGKTIVNPPEGKPLIVPSVL
ncbi:MAG: hypothetical protein K9H25_24005 [Rhodospirillum sp.]|nr:hypothetical protein [Rhodospirillum sp.]MCF8489812.1 hypothetical protein [Rhodospirillum sp.]MCF8501617.1 hypothetical protein [Rhodospirillum sp.]